MVKTKIIFRWALMLLYACILIVSGNYAYKHPAYNGDIFSYSKVVLSIDNGYTVRNLRIRDSILALEVPKERYKILLQNREKRISSTKELSTSVSFAIIKPLYIGLVYVFYKVGINLTHSTVLPSVLAYIGLGLLLIYWLLKYLSIIPSFIVALITMQWKIVVKIAALSSPDAMSSFFLLLSLYFLIEQKSFWRFYGILLLSVFTRIDNGIFGVLVLSALLFVKDAELKISLKGMLQSIGGLVIVYVIIMYIASFYGWDMLFFSSYFRDQQVGNKPMFKLDVYMDTLRYTINEAINKTKGLKFLVLGILFLIYRKHSWTIDQWVAAIFVVLFVVRTFLFPHTPDRFYIGFYIAFVVFFARAYTSYINSHFAQNIKTKDVI